MTGRVRDLADLVRLNGITGPAMIVIGSVAALARADQGNDAARMETMPCMAAAV